DGVESTNVDVYDAIFGDGSDLMDIDIPDESALSASETTLWKTFQHKVAELTLQSCNVCSERDFGLSLRDGKCAFCRSDKGDPVFKFSAENNAHPRIDRPLSLQNLTEMEEMLISRVLPMMQVRYTRG
ncbi:hypothetical protein BC628DRAFT_1277728, partial [Trametes gibbosa]